MILVELKLKKKAVWVNVHAATCKPDQSVSHQLL